ncbi:MAG: hypothetical protein K8R08_08145 [Methanosarcinales archaeon]|nr:hypothetical protein [Methanosarcinales archaeon]
MTLKSLKKRVDALYTNATAPRECLLFEWADNTGPWGGIELQGGRFIRTLLPDSDTMTFIN